jgi:MFS transporter, DHA2 family, multidrug resistance protein
VPAYLRSPLNSCTEPASLRSVERIASTLFFVFGIGLFGTTTLIPQMLQSLYGYRAIDAGLVLGPGALVITLLALVSAQLLQRQLVSAKTVIFTSLSFISLSMFVYSVMNLDTNGGHYLAIRALQSVGDGFFLVPANIIAYSQLRPDQNNKASSLTNLFRNWGGSFGIAFITTASERRANFHQMNLGSHLASSSQSLQQNSRGMVSYPQCSMGSPALTQAEHPSASSTSNYCARVNF